MKHRIYLSEEARTHLRQMSARERQIVGDGIAGSLEQEPARETRHLKALRPNPLANYELRIGTLRVFFNVDAEEREVNIQAVGRKEGNRLFIDGKEVKL